MNRRIRRGKGSDSEKLEYNRSFRYMAKLEFKRFRDNGKGEGTFNKNKGHCSVVSQNEKM